VEIPLDRTSKSTHQTIIWPPLCSRRRTQLLVLPPIATLARPGAGCLEYAVVAVIFWTRRGICGTLALQASLPWRDVISLLYIGYWFLKEFRYQTPNFQCQVWARGLGQGIMEYWKDGYGGRKTTNMTFLFLLPIIPSFPGPDLTRRVSIL